MLRLASQGRYLGLQGRTALVGRFHRVLQAVGVGKEQAMFLFRGSLCIALMCSGA